MFEVRSPRSEMPLWAHLPLKHKPVWCAYLGKPHHPAGPAVWVQLSIDTAVKPAHSGSEVDPVGLGLSALLFTAQHRCVLCFKPLVSIKWSEALNFGLPLPGTTCTLTSLLLQALWRGKSPLALRRYDPKPRWPLLHWTAVQWLQPEVLCAISVGWVSLSRASGVSGKDPLRFIRLWNSIRFLTENVKESTRDRIHISWF